MATNRDLTALAKARALLVGYRDDLKFACNSLEPRVFERARDVAESIQVAIDHVDAAIAREVQS